MAKIAKTGNRSGPKPAVYRYFQVLNDKKQTHRLLSSSFVVSIINHGLY